MPPALAPANGDGQLGRGMNLGDALQAPTEGAWGSAMASLWAYWEFISTFGAYSGRAWHPELLTALQP